MMRRRRPVGRGPGIAGTVARTAVIAGTATAVSGAVASSQHQKAAAKQQAAAQQAAEQQALADLQQQVADLQGQQVQEQLAAPAPATDQAAPAAAPAGGDLLAQLQQLGELKQAGLLSDAEFEAAKAKVLGP